MNVFWTKEVIFISDKDNSVIEIRHQKILGTYLSYIHSWIYAASNVHNNVCSNVLLIKFKFISPRDMDWALEDNVGQSWYSVK